MNNEYHWHHHYYSVFSTISEFILAFCLHVLTNLHFTAVAYSIAVTIFAVYTAVTAAHLRYSVVAIRSINRK
jgi:hypothetical protein